MTTSEVILAIVSSGFKVQFVRVSTYYLCVEITYENETIGYECMHMDVRAFDDEFLALCMTKLWEKHKSHE